MPEVNMNMNTTINTASTTGINKTFFDRDLLEYAVSKLVYSNYGVKKPIPKNRGKKIEMRRWVPFDVEGSMTPLTEGVTPDGLSLEQDIVEAIVNQYGAYFTYTDMLSLTTYDETTQSGVKRLGELMGEVADRIVRDELCSGDNVMFGGDKTARSAVTGTDKLTINSIQKAVLELETLKARKFKRGGSNEGHYICIIHPKVKYDLWNDEKWENANTYVNQEKLYSGEIGRMYGCVFVTSDNAPVLKPCLVDAVNATTTSSTSFVLKGTPSAQAVAYLSKGGNKIYVDGTAYTLAASGSYNAATKTVTLSAAASLTADKVVCSGEAGAPDATTKIPATIYQSVLFGEDSYGLIDISGSGSIKSIVKAIGQSGFDPLDQRGTVGAKIMAFACKILNEDWVLRLEHAATLN